MSYDCTSESVSLSGKDLESFQVYCYTVRHPKIQPRQSVAVEPQLAVFSYIPYSSELAWISLMCIPLFIYIEFFGSRK